jgi:serine/threonine protein kinase
LADSSSVDLIADPDRLLARADCQIVKDQRKIKVGRMVLLLNGRARSIYIKRYNAFSPRYKLGSLVIKSGALRSLEGAALLQSAAIATALPIAAVEMRRSGMLARSFFVSEEISGGKTADRYWREDLSGLPQGEGFNRRRGFLRGLAMLFAKLHAQRIYHNDLKDANILVARAKDPGERFFLLDLEGVRRCSTVSERRRIKNLVQLNRTFGRGLSRSQKFRLLKSYLGSDFSDPGKRRFWIERIIQASFVGDRRSLRKQRAP